MNNINPIICDDYPKRATELVNGAGISIDVLMFDWRFYPNRPGLPTQKFNSALVNRVNAGVQVRAVVNKSSQAKVLKEAGIKAKSLRENKTLHSKLLIIDRQRYLIGSHNFTRNGFARNYELSVEVFDADSAGRYCEFFDSLYNRP